MTETGRFSFSQRKNRRKELEKAKEKRMYQI